MKLMQVKKIYKKSYSAYYSGELIEILFYGIDKFKLISTDQHAFKVRRPTHSEFDFKTLYLPANCLKPEDHIWVDDYAFTKDGSLRRVRRTN